VFGNLIDNAYNPKIFIVRSEIALGCLYCLLGAFSSIVIYVEHESIQEKESMLLTVRESGETFIFLQAGIEIITTIQLFNWFPKSKIGIALGLLLLS